ncbi:MAG: thiamine pyrophosphate-binding protein [Wenzhouxiangellaceae bacterium]|nr:thiamine pyrophosphate-binding protein [Wenzhouxiangellaceae bacterium]
MNGGAQIAQVLHARGVREIFTLCGGHISPILVEAKRLGIRVTDVRDEATAVFAADAYARLTGIPGVAAVTAGPGLTNTITAVKNAQLAQSPLLILGGAAATALKGRGALQDIEQMPLMSPHVKFARAVKRVRDLAPAVADALTAARAGVPGPVFVECPVDLLYDQETVRKWYAQSAPRGLSPGALAARLNLNRHLRRLFAGVGEPPEPEPAPVAEPPGHKTIQAFVRRIGRARRPLMICGSQLVARTDRIDRVRDAIALLNIPVYLSGMARGLLGAEHRLLLRHRRRDAIDEADMVILAGVPCDFRLDYGAQIRRGTKLVSINLDKRDLKLNRKPHLAINADPGATLIALADGIEPGAADRPDWRAELSARDSERGGNIDRRARAIPPEGGVNPLHLLCTLDRMLEDDSVLVADGGDFVATASYTVRPRGPLRWLDPGRFGTLGVGGGFALGAARARPSGQVWILYGDGSLGYSLIEFDTYARHGLAPIAIVGNDASWAQIEREQVRLLGDDVGVTLARTDYHLAAEGLGGKGLVIRSNDEVEAVIGQAKELAWQGHPVLVNVYLAETDFREGSLSI